MASWRNANGESGDLGVLVFRSHGKNFRANSSKENESGSDLTMIHLRIGNF